MSSNNPRDNIDDILRAWPHDPDSVSVRVARGVDGREVLQMRVDLGLLQLETRGRPDGAVPEGWPTYLALLRRLALDSAEPLVMNKRQCAEVDREFVQFYHRRVCWLALRRYVDAARDADHTLALMDFCRAHSPDEQWTLSHEQYRPYVMFHRAQAAALACVENDDSREAAERAIQEINSGLESMRKLFVEHEAEEHFDDDELVKRLRDLRETIRARGQVGQTLQEQLRDAVANEQYELAARLRDEIAGRGEKPRTREM